MPLETKEESLLGEISKIDICDDTIVVLDKNSNVLLFDPAGNFINRVSQNGNGPEEYVGLNNFFI